MQNVFDELGISGTNLHSELERDELERTLFARELPAILARQSRHAGRWYAAIMRARQEAIKLMNITKDATRMAEYKAKADMYEDAARIWSAEVALFLEGLRKELADELESKYGGLAKELADDLREDCTE